MRRSLYLLVPSLALVASFLIITGFSESGKAQGPDRVMGARDSETRARESLRVVVTPWGPTQDAIDAARIRTASRPEVQRYLKGTNHRLLHFELIESDSKSASQNPPTRFLATFYDYTNNRTVRAEGSFDSPGAVKISTSDDQFVPSEEELQAAVEILGRDQIFGSALRAGELKTYPPMPPVLYPDKSGRRVERTIYVGVRPSGSSGFSNEVVGVNMIRETVIRYKSGAPPTSRATAAADCGVASAGQSTTANGTAGQYQFTITDAGGTELWSFLAIRPSASSGATSERSGIELRDVKYRGKSVLKRIHTPILNVDYVNNACGPYRDWQYQEGMFQATGTDIPGTNGGVRDCGTNIATTALESGNDTGNFKGIAFYRENDEVVLVTEMNAGWYRYICEYRLAADGTIRPRYGYGATVNSCVCLDHHHHVYWRMDFDIGTPEGNSITLGSTSGRSLNQEVKMWRYADARRLTFIISNVATGDTYMLRPNDNDGTANAFGMGDIWLLQYKSSGGSPIEINDPNTDSRANIDPWVNGESIANQDIVIWYAGHFDHLQTSGFSETLLGGPHILSGNHVQGPDIIPYRW